jgi:hypothetical protein
MFSWLHSFILRRIVNALLAMSENLIIKPEALEPFFSSWEELEQHRVKQADGEGAEIRRGRRPSGIIIAQNLRAAVKEWCDSFYFNVSDTTRQLLNHWFGRVHDRREFGGPDIFDKDPLIPTEWRGDWNLSVVLQDEASGAATGGVLYLTNIHRRFDNTRRRQEAETFDWMGPAVSKAKALDTGAELWERITSHPRLMLMNDEAHHVWDPDSAWNEAIAWLNETCRKRGGEGLVGQLDFSATPKDNRANYFKHIICDTPLGEAVDAGIVKTPIIGRAGMLVVQVTDNAAWKYEMHLKLIAIDVQQSMGISLGADLDFADFPGETKRTLVVSQRSQCIRVKALRTRLAHGLVAQGKRAKHHGQHTADNHGHEYTVPAPVVGNPTYAHACNGGAKNITEESSKSRRSASRFFGHQIQGVQADNHDRAINEEANGNQSRIINPKRSMQIEPVSDDSNEG